MKFVSDLNWDDNLLLRCRKCGKEFSKKVWIYRRQINRGQKHNHFFCSRACSASFHGLRNGKAERKIDGVEEITWGENIAYLVGLIVTDGYLFKDRPRIVFDSVDSELVQNVKEITENEITGKKYDIRVRTKDSSNENDVYIYGFTSYKFADFLREVGVCERKTWNIKSIDIPDKYFPDFLRGVTDGDGTLYYHENKGSVFYSLTSASEDFIRWIFDKIHQLSDVKGGSVSNDRDYTKLCLDKLDTRRISKYMYYDDGCICLTRKRKLADRAMKQESNATKLSESEIRNIYIRAHAEEETQSEIAEDYPITNVGVSHIKCGNTLTRVTKDIII